MPFCEYQQFSVIWSFLCIFSDWRHLFRQRSVLSPLLFAIMLMTWPILAALHVVFISCCMLMTFYYYRLQSVSYKMSCICVNVSLMLWTWLSTLRLKSCCLRIGARNNVVCQPLHSLLGTSLPWVTEIIIHIVNSKSFRITTDQSI